MDSVTNRGAKNTKGSWPFSRKSGCLGLAMFLIIHLVQVESASGQPGYGGLHDLAVYHPAVAGTMSTAEQADAAHYISTNANAASTTVFSGFSAETAGSLVDWMNARISDGKPDVLIVLDIISADLFADQVDGSLAEEWMDNGNMLLWTGSTPFGSFIDTGGMVTATDGANKVLDVSTTGLCNGGGVQEPTSALYFENFAGATLDIVVDPNGDYDINGYAAYTAVSGLQYAQLLIDAVDSDFYHMSTWRIDEIFAEDQEKRSSDMIVLNNTNHGQFAQFYTAPGMNEARKAIITQVLNNWVALPADVHVVEPGVAGRYNTIQSAIDAAKPRDTVLVTKGTYKEMLDLRSGNKRGIKIVSDDSNGGNRLIAGPGTADVDYDRPSKMVMVRANRTILDGTGGPLNRPMIDFAAGSTVGTVFDGFNVMHMPEADHTIPGHAHVVQTRGSSATIINNIVHDNGSSGLGSHSSFRDRNPLMPMTDSNFLPMAQRDFRWQNVLHEAHPILINNVVFRNEGTGLGNNHYSFAIMYNNEVFETISIEDHEAPGIGCQHGAHTLVVGNLVYKTAWVGIGGRKGGEQGIYPINRPTAIVVRKNEVYDAGLNDTSGDKPTDYPFRGSHGAAIGASDSGGFDAKTGQIQYHIIEGNYAGGAANSAIGLRSIDPDLGYVMVINNEATGGGRGGEGSGIGLDGVYAAEISGNKVYNNNFAGIGMRNGTHAILVDNNESYGNAAVGIGISTGSRADVVSNNSIYDNALVGIGVPGSTVGTLSGNTITSNGGPGIALTEGASATLISGNILSYNGTTGTAGMVIDPGVSVDLVDNKIEFSGTVNLTIAGPDSLITMDKTTLYNSGHVGVGPNLNISSGAIVSLDSSLLHTTNGGPNIHATGAGTHLTITDSTVINSDTAGIVSSGGITLTVSNSLFNNNGDSLSTAGMLIHDAVLDFDHVTISNSAHWSVFANCTGRIVDSDFYGNGKYGGGQFEVRNSAMDFIGNIFHRPGGNLSLLNLIDSSSGIYHNTFIGRGDGKNGGPKNRGPAAGLKLDGTSSAVVANNIFSSLPSAIKVDAGGSADVRTNSYFRIYYTESQIGTDQVLGNPELNSDLSPLTTSPLIDRAVRIPGVNDEFLGNAPDIGAVETF